MAGKKESMNTMDVIACVRELQFLVGGFLDKAYQPTREEVLLRFRRQRVEGEGEDPAADEKLPPGARGSTKTDVAIGLSKYVLVTEFPRENPQQPSQFARTLRKHLNGARVIAIRQYSFDRVIEFEVTRAGETFLLVVELFSDGNIILVKDGRIVAPLFNQEWAHRVIRGGAEYKPPPPRDDPRALTADAFRARFTASEADVVRTLAVEFGFGGVWAEEIASRAGVDKNASAKALPDADVTKLYDTMQRTFRLIEDGDLEPVVALAPAKDANASEDEKDDRKRDVSPVPLATHDGLELERHGTFLEALDKYFSKRVTVEREDPRVAKLREERERVDRMYRAQEGAITKFEKEAEEARRKGDVLYAHFNAVQQASERLLAAAKEHGWKTVQEKLKGARKAGHKSAQFIEAVNPHDAQGTFLLEDMEGRPQRIVVDLRKSVQENADAYYEKSKKLRDKLEGAMIAFEHTKARLREIEEKGTALVTEIEATLEKQQKATKQLWFEGYRWFVSSDGLLVIGGKDAGTNERVVKKHLGDKDRYFHADVSGAPSTVVKAPADGEGIPERTLQETAQFAFANSRAWDAGVASGEAYWVTPTQVSKTPSAGEYVGRGAFIIRGKRNYIRVQTRLALGEVEVEGTRKVMCGPVDAVRNQSKRFVVIEPGREKKNQFANRMADAFHVPVEEVQRVLPPGDVSVVETVGFDADVQRASEDAR